MFKSIYKGIIITKYKDNNTIEFKRLLLENIVFETIDSSNDIIFLNIIISIVNLSMKSAFKDIKDTLLTITEKILILLENIKEKYIIECVLNEMNFFYYNGRSYSIQKLVIMVNRVN